MDLPLGLAIILQGRGLELSIRSSGRSLHSSGLLPVQGSEEQEVASGWIETDHTRSDQ